jgi:hypothetical protein
MSPLGTWTAAPTGLAPEGQSEQVGKKAVSVKTPLVVISKTSPSVSGNPVADPNKFPFDNWISPLGSELFSLKLYSVVRVCAVAPPALSAHAIKATNHRSLIIEFTTLLPFGSALGAPRRP